MVPDNIMISFFCEKLDRKPSDISNSICASLLASSGTDTAQNWSFLSNALEELRSCYMGDVVCNFEFPPCTGSFSMNNPMWVSQRLK